LDMGRWSIACGVVLECVFICDEMELCLQGAISSRMALEELLR
jgi:hypothetical protein